MIYGASSLLLSGEIIKKPTCIPQNYLKYFLPGEFLSISSLFAFHWHLNVFIDNHLYYQITFSTKELRHSQILFCSSQILCFSHRLLKHMITQGVPNSLSAMFSLYLTLFIYVRICYVTCLMCAMSVVIFLMQLTIIYSDWNSTNRQITWLEFWQIRANWVGVYIC